MVAKNKDKIFKKYWWKDRFLLELILKQIIKEHDGASNVFLTSSSYLLME
jgi:menaquinone-dependent protoporphyrinogen IX oxidase